MQDSKLWGTLVECECGGMAALNRAGTAYCKACSRMWQADEFVTKPAINTTGYAMRTGRTYFPKREIVGLKSNA